MLKNPFYGTIFACSVAESIFTRRRSDNSWLNAWMALEIYRSVFRTIGIQCWKLTENWRNKWCPCDFWSSGKVWNNLIFKLNFLLIFLGIFKVKKGNRAPLADPSIKGSIHGITLQTTPVEVYIGTITGLAIGTHHIIERIKKGFKLILIEFILKSSFKSAEVS